VQEDVPELTPAQQRLAQRQAQAQSRHSHTLPAAFLFQIGPLLDSSPSLAPTLHPTIALQIIYSVKNVGSKQKGESKVKEF
jgi:hypothetical protein